VRRRRSLGLLLPGGLLCLGPSLIGCQATAVAVAAVQGPPRAEPQFVLPDVNTAVLIEDPAGHLSNPGTARQIASTAIYHLRLNEVLPTAVFVDPRELAKLQALLDRDWAATPIDAIGRRVGAQQVIYAEVVAASFASDQMLFRPQVRLEVKIINTEDGRRLWPPPPPLPDPEAVAPGHPLEVQLDADGAAARAESSRTPSDAIRQLADEAGRALGRLFFEWRVEEPGSSL
jgi:hypothetical protein